MKNSIAKRKNSRTIVTFLVLFILNIFVANAAPKIISTFRNLYIISDNISYLNEQRITDEVTAEINYYNSQRENLYYSDDVLISCYSRIGTINPIGNPIQLLLLVIAFLSYPVLIGLYIYCILYGIKKARKIIRRIKRNSSSRNTTSRVSKQSSAHSKSVKTRNICKK